MAQDFEKLNIQWFPGHMTKAQRMIEEHMKQVDAVCEILDARIPMASRNPDIDRLAGDKPRIVVLNRTDLADPKATARWWRPSAAGHDRARDRQPQRQGRQRLFRCGAHGTAR